MFWSCFENVLKLFWNNLKVCESFQMGWEARPANWFWIRSREQGLLKAYARIEQWWKRWTWGWKSHDKETASAFFLLWPWFCESLHNDVIQYQFFVMFGWSVVPFLISNQSNTLLFVSWSYYNVTPLGKMSLCLHEIWYLLWMTVLKQSYSK